LACGLASATTPMRSSKLTTTIRTFSVFRQRPAHAFDVFSNFGHGKDQVVFAHPEELRPIGHFVRFCHVDAAGGYRTQSLVHDFFQSKRFMKLAPLQRSKKIPLRARTAVKGRLMAGFSLTGRDD
jgi:hypothetical protein